jgi:hypothetical protein
MDKTWSLIRWVESRPKPLSYPQLPNFDISYSAGSGLSVPPRRHPHHRFVPPPSNFPVTTNAPTGHFSSPCSGLARKVGPVNAGPGRMFAPCETRGPPGGRIRCSPSSPWETQTIVQWFHRDSGLLNPSYPVMVVVVVVVQFHIPDFPAQKTQVFLHLPLGVANDAEIFPMPSLK